MVSRKLDIDELDTEAGSSGARYTLAAVPIRAQDKVLGVLGGFRGHSGELTPQEVQVLTLVGHQIGVALESARLAEEASELEILRQLDRLRSELIANVSHELRTPLGLIKLLCTILLSDDVDLDKQTHWEFLRDIEDEAGKLEAIVNNLLDLSQMESGHLHLNLRPSDLGYLVKSVLEAMGTQSSKHRFTHNLAPEPLVVTIDPVRIEQVLRNLLGNAVKYSPEGGEITVRCLRQGQQILVQVSDQGIGIPSEDLEKIFQRFYRVQNEITQRERGAGLGLAICRVILQAHGGHIWAESILGNGSTFSFTLPFDAAEESRSDEPQRQSGG